METQMLPGQCQTQVDFSAKPWALSAPGDRGLLQLGGPGTQPSMDSWPFQHLSVAFTQSQLESQRKHPLTQT